jgi:hypothetical protein
MPRIAVAGILIGLIVVAAYVLRRAVANPQTARFAPGDRVRVPEPGFWANGVAGTIARPPAPIVSLAEGWRGHVRTVATTDGPRPFYWVVLDESRRDADGDGPYQQAEIAERSLQPLGTAPHP